MTSKTTDRRQRILFDHIPKTAGVSLHHILVTKLGSAACSPVLNVSFSAARAEFDTYRFVSGHIQYEPGADLSDLWAFTVVREPIDRITSEYYYHRLVVAPDGNPLGELARSLDFDVFVETEDARILQSISNVMVNHFFLLKWDGREIASDDRRLALAKIALEEFELVGLTERFTETVDILCARLDLGPVATVAHHNANAGRPRLAAVPASVRRRLDRLNELDRELYAFARTIHDCQRRRVIFGAFGSTAGEEGPTRVVGSTPDQGGAVAPLVATRRSFGNGMAEILAIEVNGSTILGPTLLAGERAVIRVIFRAAADLSDIVVGIRISDARGRLSFGTNTRLLGKHLAIGAGNIGHVDFGFMAALGVGAYSVGGALHTDAANVQDYYHWVHEATRFEVAGNIGWHFEGAVKLNPTVSIGGAEVGAVTVRDNAAMPQRLGRHAPALTDFKARLSTQTALSELAPGELVAFPLEVANLGAEMWWSHEERCVSVSYHWLDATGRVVVFDGERSPLPQDVDPGQCVVVWAKVRAPDTVGHLYLRLTLVQEFVGWFDELGDAKLELSVLVADSASRAVNCETARA